MNGCEVAFGLYFVDDSFFMKKKSKKGKSIHYTDVRLASFMCKVKLFFYQLRMIYRF